MKAERFCQKFGNFFHIILTLCTECLIRNIFYKLVPWVLHIYFQGNIHTLAPVSITIKVTFTAINDSLIPTWYSMSVSKAIFTAPGNIPLALVSIHRRSPITQRFEACFSSRQQIHNHRNFCGSQVGTHMVKLQSLLTYYIITV